MKSKLRLTVAFSALLVIGAVGQNAVPTVTNSAKQLIVKAQKLLHDGKPAEALQVFEQAGGLPPGNEQAAEVLKVYEQAAALLPDNEKAVVGQYIILVKLGRAKDGLKVLDKWIAAKPEDPQRLVYIAMATGQTGQLEASLKAFDTLIKLQPDKGSHWVGKGQILEAMNRYAEALQAYDKAIAMNPQRGDVQIMRSEVLKQLKKSADAKSGKTKFSAAEAKDYVGETLVVVGRIAQVEIRGKQVYLNLDKRYPDSPLTCVIFAPATNRFGDLKQLEGKQVEVKGKIESYKGRPQIVLTNPDQLTPIEPAAIGNAGQKKE